MTPQPSVSKLSEVLQAILAGLQIAITALPVIQQYRQVFDASTTAHLVAPITAQASEAHPVTGAIVQTFLTAPPQ